MSICRWNYTIENACHVTIIPMTIKHQSINLHLFFLFGTELTRLDFVIETPSCRSSKTAPALSSLNFVNQTTLVGRLLVQQCRTALRMFTPRRSKHAETTVKITHNSTSQEETSGKTTFEQALLLTLSEVFPPFSVHLPVFLCGFGCLQPPRCVPRWNVSGWHTNGTLLDSSNTHIKTFGKIIKTFNSSCLSSHWAFSCWANWNHFRDQACWWFIAGHILKVEVSGCQVRLKGLHLITFSLMRTVPKHTIES